VIYKTLPYTETHLDLFYKYKHDNEFFGLSTFKKTEINLTTLDNILQKMRNFFERGIHLTELSDVYYNHRHVWQDDIESYCKLVWLAYEYLNSDRQFKNYMGIHYTPTYNTWDIHPGGSRQTIFNLFGPTDIDLITFNTGGVDRKFIETFNSKDDIFNKFGKNIDLVITAEYGSLIPHLHFDQDDLRLNILSWTDKIINFWNKTNVIGNIPNWVTKNNSTNKSKLLELNVGSDDKSLLIGLLLIPLYDNFSDFGITINVKNSII